MLYPIGLDRLNYAVYRILFVPYNKHHQKHAGSVGEYGCTSKKQKKTKCRIVYSPEHRHRRNYAPAGANDQRFEVSGMKYQYLKNISQFYGVAVCMALPCGLMFLGVYFGTLGIPHPRYMATCRFLFSVTDFHIRYTSSLTDDPNSRRGSSVAHFSAEEPDLSKGNFCKS